MPASYSRVLWIVLVPALAVAGPKDHKKTNKKADKAAEKKDADTGGAGDKDAKDSKDAPRAGSEAKDAPKDAAKDESLLSTGTVGGGASGGGAGSAAGGGSGSAAGDTAAKPDKPAKEDQPPANEPDVDALRQEYLTLRDELFKSRARANAVASQLYSTRITIKFTWGSGRYYGVSKASVRLDGASVFEGTDINDDGVRFDGYVAPGRHLVTFHVEASGKDDDSFTSATESQVVVKAVAQKDLVVAAKARDSGDIAYAWKKGEHGSYGLGIDIAVKTTKPSGEAPAPAKGKK